MIENIENLDYPNLEIILSDRHGHDDALDALRRRFAGDPRLVFVESDDNLDWVGHYNWLLGAASGEYFCWMPHDDSFPPGYIGQLVACLEEEREVVLAYGRIEGIGLDGSPRPVFTPPPEAAGEPWSPALALRFLTRWNLGIPFRGVFRRADVIGTGLYIRPTRGNILADKFWVFGLSLTGPIRYLPSCHCTKRLYPTSTHAQWRYGVGHLIDSFRVLRSYARDLSPSRRQAIHGMAVIFLWTLLRAFVAAARRSPFPQLVERGINRPLKYLLRVLVDHQVIRAYVDGPMRGGRVGRKASGGSRA